MSKKSATLILNNLHGGIKWENALLDATAELEKARDRVRKLEYSIRYFKEKVEKTEQLATHS